MKNNSGLHPHQTLNKRIWLMKRESGRNPTHRFSLGERFDETPMKIYYISYQYIRLSNHQFIGFSSLIKSAVGTAALSQPVCLYADMQSCRHSGKGYHTRLAKRETFGSSSCSPSLASRQAALNTVDANAKNAPMNQRGCTPLDTPFVPKAAASCPLSCPKTYELLQGRGIVFLW